MRAELVVSSKTGRSGTHYFRVHKVVSPDCGVKSFYFTQKNMSVVIRALVTLFLQAPKHAVKSLGFVGSNELGVAAGKYECRLV